jgi:hypothetical protein
MGNSVTKNFDEHSGCNRETPFDSLGDTSETFRMTRRLEDSEE